MFKKKNPEVGAPPGTLVFRKDPVPSRVVIVRYSSEGVQTIPDAGLSDIEAPDREDEFLWLDVSGVEDADVLRAGGKRFGLSDLVMEDIVNVPQRPKSELVDGKILSIAHILRVCSSGELDIDQISVVLGPNFVVTVHSQPIEYLGSIRKRLYDSQSRLRQCGPDYLAYSILDHVIDGYYPVLEVLGERLEHLEDESLHSSDSEVLRGIHRLRSQLIQVRRSSWPMREAMDFWSATDTPLVDSETKVFLRDARSHCAQVVDVVEMYRESAAALVSTYMSAVAHRSNEIMKVLALVSSVFVPMSFISGVYGMNFDNMPELSHPWAYPMALITMASIALFMLYVFVRRGWLGWTSLRSYGATAGLTVATAVPRERAMASGGAAEHAAGQPDFGLCPLSNHPAKAA